MLYLMSQRGKYPSLQNPPKHFLQALLLRGIGEENEECNNTA
jgi:hypothetical protein